MAQRSEKAEQMVNTRSAAGGREYTAIILAVGGDEIEKVKSLVGNARLSWCTDEELGRKEGVADHLMRSAARFLACDCLRWLIQSNFYALVRGSDASRASELMQVCLSDEFEPAARVVQDELLKAPKPQEREAWEKAMNGLAGELLPQLSEKGRVERLDWIARSLSAEIAVRLAKNPSVEPFLSSMPALKAIAEAHEIRGEIAQAAQGSPVARAPSKRL